MEELNENSVLQSLYEQRNSDFSHIIIKDSEEFKNEKRLIEQKVKEVLNYVPGENNIKLANEIEDYLFDHISNLSQFWCSRFYKLGFADGLNVKKELEKEFEEIFNEEYIKNI